MASDMSKMRIQTFQSVRYPEAMREKMMVYGNWSWTLSETEGQRLGGTLKWGEPSYLLRAAAQLELIGRPNFNCNTPLVETFKRIYGHITVRQVAQEDSTHRRGEPSCSANRTLPIDELKHCVRRR